MRWPSGRVAVPMNDSGCSMVSGVCSYFITHSTSRREASAFPKYLDHVAVCQRVFGQHPQDSLTCLNYSIFCKLAWKSAVFFNINTVHSPHGVWRKLKSLRVSAEIFFSRGITVHIGLRVQAHLGCTQCHHMDMASRS